ncbi:uncharacterized protein TNCV_3650941 [Trichonephila clavipes]|uniref:Uncharacterized protein n=1 Tax=Trichonephila clavipes TaxID=2585209 RepID=A0A8X6SE66_TRICX|nr:uncharacterized protein TNCV_3650941 [Trichonephila clavipes]
MEFLKNRKDFFKDLRLDTALNEMLCDAREFNDEIDIPANFKPTQPRHTFRRRNVNFNYEAREDLIEVSTLKYKAEFYFFTTSEREIKLSMHLNPGLILSVSTATISKFYTLFIPFFPNFKRYPQNDELKYCKNLETVLTNGNTSDINALDLEDEIVAV